MGASMRPRVFPAEDGAGVRLAKGDYIASMRPRVFPAEDSWRPPPTMAPPPACFNEAAGIPRGRLARIGQRHLDGETASMRPRVFPAEDR